MPPEPVDRDYWNSLAETYGRDLLEIVHEAGAGVLRDEIARFAAPEHRVADLGCGPGSLLPFLSKHFREVVAVDYAEELLDAARRRCGERNVTFHRHDLSSGKELRLEVEVACCVNALIDPDRRKREMMVRTVASSVAAGGTVVIIVPALESVFHVYHSLLRCRRRQGSPAGLTEKQAERDLAAEVDSLAGGIVRVGGVPTKYWMREEIAGALEDHELMVKRMRRVEYAWKEEIDDPPAWLLKPQPWDWLVVAQRVTGA